MCEEEFEEEAEDSNTRKEFKRQKTKQNTTKLVDIDTDYYFRSLGLQIFKFVATIRSLYKVRKKKNTNNNKSVIMLL